NLKYFLFLESPNNFIEEVHFTLKQNRTEIHAAEKLTDGSILDLKNATSYLTQVRKTVGKHSHLYSNYLAILKKFKSHSIDTCDVMEKVTDLFKGHPNLIVGFMRFLPSEYIVDVLCNEQNSATKRRAVSGHIYNKSSDQPVKNNNDNFAVPLQNNPDSDVVNGVVPPFNHIKNKCESIPSDNLMVPAIRQSKKSVISSITKRVTPTIVRVQENADILFGNHLVSVVRPRRKKSRFSQAIESIETEASEPTLDKVVPGDATSDDCTENSVEVVLQNTNNCIKTLRSELVPTKRQQYYRAKSVVSMSYLDEVKFTFGSESQTYDDFLDIVYKFHTQSMNTPDFIDKLINLFKDHPKLIIEFNKYLPPSYKIEVLGFKPETLSDSIIPGLKHRVSSELKEDCQIRSGASYRESWETLLFGHSPATSDEGVLIMVSRGVTRIVQLGRAGCTKDNHRLIKDEMKVPVFNMLFLNQLIISAHKNVYVRECGNIDNLEDV
ncbi:unnamed protein product, partial [Timema podura]|nr:unnamed protein product [Timema podura]